MSEITLRTALESAVEAVRNNERYWYDEDGKRRLAADEWKHELLAEGLEALGSVNVLPDDLTSVTSLNFYGGAEIYIWFETETATCLGARGMGA
jgi:hypothetical protein